MWSPAVDDSTCAASAPSLNDLMAWQTCRRHAHVLRHMHTANTWSAFYLKE